MDDNRQNRNCEPSYIRRRRMGKICTIKACSTGTQKNCSDRSALRFRPLAVLSISKQNNVLQKWSKAIGWKLSETDLFCEPHFNIDNVIREDEMLVKDGTVHVIR